MNTKILFFLLLILAACNPSRLEDPIVIADVEEEFIIYPREVLNTSTPKELEWVIVSKNTEPCQNYEIKARLEKNSTNLSLYIDEITNPDDCIEGEIIPSLILNSGKINQTTYNFNITLKKTIENSGHLKKTDNRYTIQIGSENGIDLQHKELIAIPNEALWGYMGWYEGLEADQIASALGKMKDLWPSNNLPSGFYGHFVIMPGVYHQPALLELPEYELFQTVLLTKADKNNEAIQQELDLLKSQMGNSGINIVLFDNTGKVYR